MTSADHHFATINIIQNQAIGKRSTDPLPRLLAQLIERTGEPATVERAVSRPWASALFEGRRHIVRMHLGGSDPQSRLASFRRGLADAEWSLTGHFVADIHVDDHGVVDDGLWLELSALTIRDW